LETRTNSRRYYGVGEDGHFSTHEEQEKENQTKAARFRQNCMLICDTMREDLQNAYEVEQPLQTTWNGVQYASAGEAWDASIRDNPYSYLLKPDKEAVYQCTPNDLMGTGDVKDISLTHDVNPLTGEVRELSDSEKINRKIVHDADQILNDATDINFTSNVIKEVSAQSSTPPLIKTDVQIAENFGSAATPAAPATEAAPENKSIMFAKAEPVSPFANSPLNLQSAP